MTTITDPAERCRVLHGLKTDIVDWVHPAQLVVVESMVPNPKSRSTNERGALWYMVVLALLNREVSVMFVHPGTLKRYATGGGRADKDAMKTATVEAFPDTPTKNDDERDALWLAAVGVHLLDGPLPYPVTETRAKVLAGIRASPSAA